MAARYATTGKPYRTQTSRSNSRYANSRSYVYGNAVKQPSYIPEPRRRGIPERKAPVKSKKTKRLERANARSGKRYVFFMTICMAFVFLMCVNYVRLQSQVTNSARSIAALQEELTELKEDNTTKYNSIMDSVNLEEVRKKATKKLGMVFAKSSQVVKYEGTSADYVEQYEKIPKSGVIASDDKH